MAGKLIPEASPSTIMPGSTLPAYVELTSMLLVRNRPIAQPKNPAASSGLTPIRGIRPVPSPMPAPMVSPNGR